jgi:trans-aconitate methyltransferase
MFEPYAVDLARRVPLHGATRVLELACGTGIVTRRLRASLPESATLVARPIEYSRARRDAARQHVVRAR